MTVRVCRIVEVGTGVPHFKKLSETPLKVLTVKNVKLNVQNTFELRCCFLWILRINSKSNYFWRLWDNAAISQVYFPFYEYVCMY